MRECNNLPVALEDEVFRIAGTVPVYQLLSDEVSGLRHRECVIEELEMVHRFLHVEVLSMCGKEALDLMIQLKQLLVLCRVCG